MEQNKDQSGAAVRALLSDLTEAEQINLLCKVEDYMAITDKHSQTHPEAAAEESRLYSLVNALIAKRLPDIGAAVRGEAVAWAVTAQRGGIHKLSITKDSADRKAAAWREEWPENGCRVRPLVFGDASPDLRGAGVREAMPDDMQWRDQFWKLALALDCFPSQFIDANEHVFKQVGFLKDRSKMLGETASELVIANRKLAEIAESRAADALDSQPTENGNAQLMRFYAVDTVQALIAAQESHIGKLQAKLPRDNQAAFTRVREG